MILVNSSLPVNLTSSHVQQYPDFTKLLTSLTRHVTDSGMSLAVYKGMKQVSDFENKQGAGFNFGFKVGALSCCNYSVCSLISFKRVFAHWVTRYFPCSKIWIHWRNNYM